jgi:hypothetical protein
MTEMKESHPKTMPLGRCTTDVRAGPAIGVGPASLGAC